MAILSKGTTYSNGDQPTAANLNALVDSATFDDPADETSIEKNTGTGKLQIKDGGVSTAKIAADAVTGAKIADDTINSEHYAADSIDNEHLAANAVAGSGTGATGDNAVEAGSIGHADLNDDIISGQDALAVAPADTDELMISDGGTVKRIDVSDFAKHPAFPRAYGVVDFDSGQTTYLGNAYNVSSVAGSGTTERTVTLSVTMDNATEYIVLVSITNAGAGFDPATAEIVDATSFKIKKDDQAIDPKVSFVVYGTLA